MAEPIGSIDSVLVRAAHLTAEGRPQSAIAMLRPALELFPEHSAAWCRLAAAQLDAGEPGESLAAAKQAMTLGERSWAHRLASLALVELGRHDEAVVSAHEAVRRDAADWRCHVTLAEALAHDSPVAAMRVARAAVALAPDEPRAHEVLGDSAVVTHDWAAAENAYLAALRLDPGNDDVTAKVGRLARRPPEHPARRRRPVRTRSAPRFGRVERVALLLAVRRAAAWQAVGSFVLLVAGLPAPNRLLVWFGLGVVVFVALLAWRGWLGLPAGARVSPRELSAREPLIAAAAVSLGGSVLLLLLWNVLLALGSAALAVLVAALGCAAVAAAAAWFGLARIWPSSR